MDHFPSSKGFDGRRQSARGQKHLQDSYLIKVLRGQLQVRLDTVD